MELELNKVHLTGYETVLETTAFREETLETIVPDAGPDILRLIDTQGMVFLKGKAATDGRVVLTGTARLTVLYQPDGGTGPCRMEVAIPFNLAAEDPRIKSGCMVSAVPRLVSAETRTANPRKVITRVEIAADLKVYMTKSSVVSAAVSATDGTVEQRKESRQISLIAAVQEKQITFEDDLSIPAGRPAAQELMGSRVELQCRETKLIGNKLVFKGDAQVRLLYRPEGGGVDATDFVLPFSQITEVIGVGEESGCSVEMALSGAEFVLGGDGRTVSASLNMLAQVAIREERSIELLTDAYSVCAPVRADLCDFEYQLCQTEGTGRQTVREVIETGMQIKTVVDSFCTMGRVTRQREAGQLRLGVQLTINALCLTGDDEYGTVFRSMDVGCLVDVPEDCSCQFSCVCSNMAASPTADGVEVRFQLDFPYCAVRTVKAVVVEDVTVEPVREEDMLRRPSIVLCVVEEGEQLWGVAKRYATAVEDIVKLNELESEQITGGMLLLIPKKR